MRRYWVLKVSVTSVVIGIFLFLYLYLLHNPSYPVTTMPSTALDRSFPLVPEALFVYMTLWLYVGAGPGLQLRFLDLINYTAWSVMLCVAGLVIFYFWPTQVPAHGLDLSPYLVLQCCRESMLPATRAHQCTSRSHRSPSFGLRTCCA